MANKRMFSMDIVDSSRFLRMSATARLLYYDLGVNADDDGFVEWYSVITKTKASEQDMIVLHGNGFIHVFNDEVLVILDWRVNNFIKSDRYKPTIHSGYFKALELRENRYYVKESAPVANGFGTKMEPVRIQDGSKMEPGLPEPPVTEPQDRLELGEDRDILPTGNISVDEAKEMRELWREHTNTTLRNHERENLQAYRYLTKELGADLAQYLQAVRMIRADRFQKRTLQERLFNYVGLREKLDQVEAYMQGQVDKHYQDHKILEAS